MVWKWISDYAISTSFNMCNRMCYRICLGSVSHRWSGKIYNRLQYCVHRLLIFSSVCNLTLVNLLLFLYYSCCTLFSFLFFFRITGHYNFNRTYFPTGRSCSAIRRSSFLVYTIITPRRYN